MPVVGCNENFLIIPHNFPCFFSIFCHWSHYGIIQVVDFTSATVVAINVNFTEVL